MQPKYINPYTDFGFKKIFGEEASKPLLIDFLNAVLPDQPRIVDLHFKNSEQLGIAASDRKVVYDIFCESVDGEKFIVELQKAKQNYFKERTVYYSTFPIKQQAEKGIWNYDLKAVFCIGILDFCFDDTPNKQDYRHVVQLKDQHCRVFYDKLTLVYLEMPRFNKAPSELVTRLDKWLFFIKNLESFEQIPDLFKDSVFLQAFDHAEFAKLDEEEQFSYEMNLKQYRDYQSTVDFSYQEGVDDTKKSIAKTLKLQGMAPEIIAEITGLPLHDVMNL